MKDFLIEAVAFVGGGIVFCLIAIFSIVMLLLPFAFIGACIGACIAVAVIVVRALTGL